MRWKKNLSVLALSVVSFCAQSQVQPKLDSTMNKTNQDSIFIYGGLHLNISPAKIKENFPRSYFNEQEASISIHINKADMKDGVSSAVIFLQNKKPHYALLPLGRQFDEPMPEAFMRKVSNTHHACEPTLQQLTKIYGHPFGPLDGRDEGVLFKDYVWENKTDKMILSCGRYAADKSKKTYAWTITFAQNGAGGCHRRNCIDPPQ